MKSPYPFPSQFYDILVTRLTSGGPGLRVVDHHLDWLVDVLLKDLLQHIILLVLRTEGDPL